MYLYAQASLLIWFAWGWKSGLGSDTWEGCIMTGDGSKAAQKHRISRTNSWAAAVRCLLAAFSKLDECAVHATSCRFATRNGAQ